MALATWWTTDPLPDVSPLPGFELTAAVDDTTLSQLNGISLVEVRARRTAGHRPYVGVVDGTPVTYGWVATQTADIGELDLRFRLPSGDRYLWDFATLPAWQRRRLYPRLLAAILTRESPTAGRFWIIHAPENLPSGAGMHKAGFTPVGRLSFDAGGHVALTPTGPVERAEAGARLLGVPLVVETLSPCWRCQIEAAAAATDTAPPGCSRCVAGSPATETCTCAIQRRPSSRPAA